MTCNYACASLPSISILAIYRQSNESHGVEIKTLPRVWNFSNENLGLRSPVLVADSPK